MIDFEKWKRAVIDFETYYKKKHARVTCIDGEVYEGICRGYHEDDDSNGNSVWAIMVGMMSFRQEEVEKIEFID